MTGCVALATLWLALAPATPSPSVPPLDPGTCPASHPVKATVSPRTRECVFHLPDGAHYRTVRPDVCYASPAEARREGCWQAREVL